MNENILVCGGAGYIGSVCIRELSQHGYNCVVYDNFSLSHKQACAGFETVSGDILDKPLLVETIKRYSISGVIHFASLTQVGESVAAPLGYYRNNAAGSMNLVEAMVECGVRDIVFSSTCAVYGDNAAQPISESAELLPCSPYGETKLAVERMLKWCGDAYGIRHVSLRYFNAAGALPDGSIGEDHKPESHLIPIVLKRALSPEMPLSVFGDDYKTPDGSCVRDYIHVLDLASAHIKALSYLRAGGESDAFNLGTGKGTSVLEIINTASRVTGCDIPYSIAPRRAGDADVLVADASKAYRVLGWKPENSDLSKIIGDAWMWHKLNPDGYGG